MNSKFSFINNFKDQFKNSFKYLYLTLSLILTFWLLSLFEIAMTLTNGPAVQNIVSTIIYKLLNDFGTGLIIGIVFYPLYLACFFIKKPYDQYPIKILFASIVIGQFALVKYSLTTLINLGADILGYSVDDMYTTVTASEQLSFIYFVPFVLFPMLYLGITTLLNRYSNEKQTYMISGVIFILFGGIKLTVPAVSDSDYQNKLHFFASDILRFQNEKSLTDVDNIFYKKEYPLMKPFKETKDVLAPFFKINEEKPNIVFIIVEGLGSEFIGNNAYRGFTPFLDSMIPKSLYWENFVSNAGRTFGVVPSILGSLPYGEKGFLEQNPIPSHVSLVSILKANNYKTSYFSGDESSFDRKINFFEYNEIDQVIDVNKFGSGYVKTQENEGGFSWGYPDAEIFKKTLTDLNGDKKPRLDVIMTLSNHEPFNFPSKNTYLKQVDAILNSDRVFGVDKEEIRASKDVFASLLYTDNSIKDFMEQYSKKPEYQNTIFIITGDHRLIPVSQKDKLCRFHVPLMIYSPMLKKTEKFKSISSHWDVTPSLVSFLMNNYKFNKLEKTAWMGDGLDTEKKFRNIHKIPLMRYKGSVNDYIYKEYMYSDGELYKINEDFGIYKVNENELLKTVTDSLNEFKRLNAYLTKKNKIFPEALNFYVQPAIRFSKNELVTIQQLTKGLNFDQTFIVARDLAFKKDYKKSRLLCNYILNEIPNYSDARTLKGRTLAWEGNYKEAEVELLSVIKRTPYYDDVYLALMDLYWWSKQDLKEIEVAKKATENEIKNPTIQFKLAEAYKRLNKITESTATINNLIKTNPGNPDYLTFKKSLQ